MPGKPVWVEWVSMVTKLLCSKCPLVFMRSYFPEGSSLTVFVPVLFLEDVRAESLHEIGGFSGEIHIYVIFIFNVNMEDVYLGQN